jgi:hypothetical protein
LHSGKHGEEVQLCAFDVLAMDGDDLRRLPLSMRKANLARLLRRRPEGIFINPFEQGEIGPDLFPQGLRVRAGGPRLEASRPALSIRQLKALDQGQEPEASSNKSRIWRRCPKHFHVHGMSGRSPHEASLSAFSVS